MILISRGRCTQSSRKMTCQSTSACHFTPISFAYGITSLPTRKLPSTNATKSASAAYRSLSLRTVRSWKVGTRQIRSCAGATPWRPTTGPTFSNARKHCASFSMKASRPRKIGMHTTIATIDRIRAPSRHATRRPLGSHPIRTRNGTLGRTTQKRLTGRHPSYR